MPTLGTVKVDRKGADRDSKGDQAGTMTTPMSLQDATISALADVVEEAHRGAIHLEPRELANELQELLGQKLVAYAAGDRHPKSIGRYARGEREPAPETLGALVTLRTVVGILRNGMSDNAPIAALHEGRAHEVFGAAQAFVTRR
jgi:hypothetical protein